MQAFFLLSLVAAAVAMPWGGPELSHSVSYAQPQIVQHVQPQIVHAAPQIIHAAPQIVHAAPQYVHAPQVIKTVQPASSYASFSQEHHSVPVVKQVYAQPIVKQVVAQPVYTQQVVKQVVAQPVYKQVVSAHPSYSHNSW